MTGEAGRAITEVWIVIRRDYAPSAVFASREEAQAWVADTSNTFDAGGIPFDEDDILGPYRIGEGV